MQHTSTPAPFQWQRSDNSFAFNFNPDVGHSSPQSVMDPNESHAGRVDAGSGFIFNFQIPTGTKQDSDLKPSVGKTVISDATEGLEKSENSKPKTKKKKKKKKPGSGGEAAAMPNSANKSRDELPKQEATELTPEQQLSRELDWCIEQLELGLKTQKSSTKQREDASRALKTLRSSKAPTVKKRQVMRAVSGDYRKKMEEDRDRQHKLICSAMSSAKVMRVSEPRCKAVYHRHAETLKPPAHSIDNSKAPLPAEQSDGVGDRFVFRPSGAEFRFNFNL